MDIFPDRVAILHPCYYMRKGIEHILGMLPGKVEIISSTTNIEHCTDTLCQQHIDLLVLGLNSPDYTVAQALRLLTTIELHAHQCRRVVIFVDTALLEMIQAYLSLLPGVMAVVDEATLPVELIRIFDDVMAVPVRHTPVFPPKTKVLSARESAILQGLLQGQSLTNIAFTLHINRKTVSQHKRNALNKLGLDKLHSLLLNQRYNPLLLNCLNSRNQESGTSPRAKHKLKLVSQ